MSKAKIVGIVVALVALIGGAVALAQMSSKDETVSTKDDSSSSMDSSMKMDESSKSTENSTSTDTSMSAESSTSNTVEIKDYAYAPASITVKKGTKVTWTNKDSVKHDVATDTDGKGPSSELLAQGESYSFTFDEVGTFTYHCSPHPYMKGTVIVTE